jgi:fatty acid desaturase
MAKDDQAAAGSPLILPRDNPEPRSPEPRSPEPRSPEPGPGRGSDYAVLSRRIKQAGLLQRRPAWYIVRISLQALALAVGWAAFLVLGDSWWQLATAVFLAVVFSQLGFVTHDAGHRQMFRTRRPNDRVGLIIGDLLIGISYGWWVGKHNRHHANPNNVEEDPDVVIGAVAFTTDQALAKRGLLRVIARHQAWLFFPLLSLQAAQLHVQSVRSLLRQRGRAAVLEGLLLTGHLLAYLGAVVTVLSPLRALLWIAVQQGLFGVYLGCSFAPNHKGMPILSGRDELDHLRRQVLTSRNVRGNRFLEFALGGLNYQIEHHLFPSMPRPNLRHAQPIVRAFCQQHGLPYAERGTLGSFAEVLGHLHAVGAPLRRPRTPSAPEPAR